MKKLRLLSALLAMLMLTAIVSGCKGDAGTSSGSDWTSSDDYYYEDGGDNNDGDNNGGGNYGGGNYGGGNYGGGNNGGGNNGGGNNGGGNNGGGNTTGGNKNPNNTTGNNKNPNKTPGTTSPTESITYASEVSKVDKDFGVKDTTKMPNYISQKIKSSALTMIVTAKSSEDSLQTIRKQFKALTGKDIQVDEQVVDWNTLPDRVAGLIEAQQSPDLVMYSTLYAPYMVQRPYWENLDNYINMNDALWECAQDYNPDDIYVYKNGRYAVQPYVPSPNGGTNLNDGYIYNTKLVKEAIAGNSSLKDPQTMFANGDWTWDALYDFAEEITTDSNSDGTPEIYGHVMQWSSLSYYIASIGQDIIRFGGDNGKISYNLENANVTKALNFVKKLYNLSNDPAPWDGIKNVIAGKAGFYFGNAWHMKDSDAAIKAHKNGQIAYVPMPRANGTNTYYVNAGANSAWFIPKGAKNPYLAAAYLYYQQYLGYNPNKTIEQEQIDNLKAWGYSEVEIQYMTASYTKVKPKPVFSGIGERIDGYDYNTLHFAIQDPTKTVAQAVATVAPTLKAAIDRFNNAH